MMNTNTLVKTISTVSKIINCCSESGKRHYQTPPAPLPHARTSFILVSFILPFTRTTFAFFCLRALHLDIFFTRLLGFLIGGLVDHIAIGEEANTIKYRGVVRKT